ncbi:unnamed protein product [Onchocerca ochengi]|uniref:Uncharacterized protein n=1 Tax=Onchocerca ochengi TaxID=42157 RepID=A0A182ES30_ONCOC|nr:unnamed protein product [Onchocerca ochengi]
MNSPNTSSSNYGRNLKRNYRVANVQRASTSTIITAVGRNVPNDKLHRIFPIHENVNSKNWFKTQRDVLNGDSVVESASTNNSPEVIGKYRENLNDATNQFTPFQEPLLIVVPPHLLRPLDTLINEGQRNFSGEAYNYWLNTGTAQSKDIQLPPGLEEMSWWADTISDAYPFINRPCQNIKPYPNATHSTNEQCCSTLC